LMTAPKRAKPNASNIIDACQYIVTDMGLRP
jgi:hypothetical protein